MINNVFTQSRFDKLNVTLNRHSERVEERPSHFDKLSVTLYCQSFRYS